MRTAVVVLSAIGKFGGFAAVAKALGYDHAEMHRWNTVEDLRPHLDPFVATLGRMPTAKELQERDGHALTSAISKFGGFGKVASALGYPHASRRSWNDPNELRAHLDPIVQDLGRMPTGKELAARGCTDLEAAFKKFGGLRAVAALLGYRYEGRRQWSTLEDLQSHLDPIVAELGRMPNFADLQARNRLDLVGAIKKIGGYPKVAALFGYQDSGRWFWQSVEDLRPFLQPVVDEIGRMPTQSELDERGISGLAGTLRKFGGMPRVAELLGYRYLGKNEWLTVEDLRPYLEPIVAELQRMPNTRELVARNLALLEGPIRKFGGPAQVAEALGFPYTFAPALERRTRLVQLESALIELHGSQMLSAGQVMLILRHAGLLSVGRVADFFRRLPLDNDGSTQVAGLDVYLSSTFDSDRAENQLQFAEDDLSPQASNGRVADSGLSDEEEASAVGEKDVETIQCGNIVDADPSTLGQARDRAAEVKELRGWSHLGNLLDPAPALIQLSVTRLKTAFYRFANEVRGSLEAPADSATTEEVEHLKDQLWQSAFGEYGGLMDNDLVREACETYVTDLASALLLPRQEAEYIPRLYQLDGARFVADRVRSDKHPYGLLFDQPGMGKTLTTLWGLAAGGMERVAIVAPLTVKREVWTIAQIRQAFPELDEGRFASGLDAALALPFDGPVVAILHYEELRRHDEIRRLVAPRPDGSSPFDVIVFDEAHEVKERLSTSTRGPTRTGAWLMRQGAPACIGLTATPVVNELYEPVSLLQLVQGRRSSDAGRRLQSRRLRDRVDVMEYLLADSLRRLKPDVLFEIPPREIVIHEIVPDAELLAHIRTFLSRGRRAISAQLSSYRRLMVEAKLDWIAGIVRGNITARTPDGLPDPKTLVLCYNVEGVSRRVYERLTAEIGADRVLHVDGTTTDLQRQDAFRRFRDPADAESGVAVLVGTVGTVGVGVTLFDPKETVTPHRVVFADLPFTWAEFEQGVDRLHRVGQKFPVRVDVPVVTFGEQLTRADGEPLKSFDQGVWEWIRRKQRLADQVLDAAFDVSDYKDAQIRRAIGRTLRAIEEAGGAIVAPAPPANSPAAEHRQQVGRLRGMPRERTAEHFRDPEVSERFLAANDASPAAQLAQRLVRERLGRWLDRRSAVIDLGCGSNPLRDLPCERVIGIDRHGANGGLIADSAATKLSSGEADFVVMSLSMWGTPEDRLAYLREAKRLLRPIGKLVVVEPAQTFGGTDHWRSGVTRFKEVVEQLGMQLVEARDYTVDQTSALIALIIDNSSAQRKDDIDPSLCVWRQ